MPIWTKDIIQIIFECALFANAILFIPQAVRIIKDKSAKNVALTTFLGFWLIQLFTIAHGVIEKDTLLIIGYAVSLVTCGLVVVLILVYRKS